MTEIGTLLRETRERLGLTLEQVEQATRIRARFLWALEESRWEELGGEVYARGFLRNYAVYLGLDPDPLLARFRPTDEVWQPAQPAREPRYLSEPLTHNPFPTVRLLLMLIGALLVGSAAYLIWSQPQRVDRLLVSAGLELAPADVTVTRTAIPLRTDEPARGQQVIIEPYRSPTPPPGSIATPVPTATLPPRTPTPAPNATPSATPTPSAPDGVIVGAQILADTWVRVFVDAQDSPVIERVLRSGESFEWVGEQEVALRVGNAGGISVTLNGTEMGPLGNAGEVREFRWRSNPEGGSPILVDPQG